MDTTGITQADMPPVTALEVVLVEAVTSERVDSTIIMAELGVREGDMVATPTLPTRIDRDSRAVVRTVSTEVSQIKLIFIGVVGNVV